MRQSQPDTVLNTFLSCPLHTNITVFYLTANPMIWVSSIHAGTNAVVSVHVWTRLGRAIN